MHIRYGGSFALELRSIRNVPALLESKVRSQNLVWYVRFNGLYDIRFRLHAGLPGKAPRRRRTRATDDWRIIACMAHDVHGTEYSLMAHVQIIALGFRKGHRW